jgi:hypothetical protein
MGIRTKVVGVTKDNGDGVNRQDIIRKYCRGGMDIQLVAEPDNRYDGNAIGVWVATGLFSKPSKLGYLRSELAADLRVELRSGKSLRGTILEVTGGGRDKNYGVNIEVETRAGRRLIRGPATSGCLVLLGLAIGVTAIGMLTRRDQRTRQPDAPQHVAKVQARASVAVPETKELSPEEKHALEAAAMLREARQLDSFGRIQAGVQAYKEVVRKFPESKEAEFARARLKAMGEDSN